jgi:hypothetical protein
MGRYKHEITKDEIRYFVERTKESHTGVLLFSTHLVNKYRFLFADYHSDNSNIRFKILSIVSPYCGQGSKHI